MTTPWFLRAIWRAPRSVLATLRGVVRFLWFGPESVCWEFGCWEPTWHGCHASAKRGCGRMCREHCHGGLHSRWATGCQVPLTSIDRAMGIKDEPALTLTIVRRGPARRS